MRRDLHAEDGVAIPAVLLAIIILLGLSTVLIANAMGELRATDRAERFESTLHVAETSAQVALARMAEDPNSYDTGQTWNAAAAADERNWAITQADAVTQYCDDVGAGFEESCIVPGPDGESVFVRPLDDATGDPMKVLYSVGYEPSKAAARTVRVVKMDLTISSGVFAPNHALLTAGSLDFDGANSGSITGANGSVHSNGDITGFKNTEISQSLTWSGDTGPACHPTCTNVATGAAGATGQMDPVRIPTVSAAKVYNLPESNVIKSTGNWYDLCGVDVKRGVVDGEPCTGTLVPTADIGWQRTGSDWTPKKPAQANGNVFYVHGANASMSSNEAWHMSVIIAKAADGTGGNWSSSGSPTLKPYYPGILILADGDVSLSGTSLDGGGSPAVVAAGGMLDLRGNYNANGIAFLAGGGVTSQFGGTANIHFDGNLSVDLGDADQIAVGRWAELFPG